MSSDDSASNSASRKAVMAGDTAPGTDAAPAGGGPGAGGPSRRPETAPGAISETPARETDALVSAAPPDLAAPQLRPADAPSPADIFAVEPEPPRREEPPRPGEPTVSDLPPPFGTGGTGPLDLKPLPGEPAPGQALLPPMGPETFERPRAAEVRAAPAAGPGKKKSVPARPQLWTVPEEPRGRRAFALIVMLILVGLYAWFLSFYYAGAHPGVDQAGYLMTARLITGDRDIDTPPAPARVTPATQPLPADKAPAIWQGGASGYVTDVHPQPAPVQLDPSWDWLRNRLSFVPESPFQYVSRMCVMTEPYGPAVPDAPQIGARAAVTGKPAEYRIYAKYPFGFPLLAALGREADASLEADAGPRAPRHGPAQNSEQYVERSPQVRDADANNPPRVQVPATGTRPATSIALATQPEVENGRVTRVVPAAPAPPKPVLSAAERAGRGFAGMYVVNPLCTVLAVLFSYFMFRQAVSTFAAMMGALWVACNPLILAYANDANSHASTLMCVCVGFWGLLSFLRTGGIWRAWIGGFFLGYACTIRYSEFLLVLPVVFAAALNFRFKWRSALGSLSLLAAWALPIAALAIVCWVSFGSPTKTGYTYCNEDTGFGWKYLTGNWEDREVTGNWETLVTQINRVGLFLMWPLALGGLFGMLGAAWRLGTTLALWVIPATFLYMLYYWAPGGDQTTGYLRFYVTVMPGYIFCGIWLMDRLAAHVQGEKWAGLAIGTMLSLLLLLIIAFIADGGPAILDGGLKKMIFGFIEQTPRALGHLFSTSWIGLASGCLILALLAGMWILDRDLIGKRLALALAGGALTALGCAINLQTIMPAVERNFNNQVALRVTVDNMRESWPRGSVLFADDSLLQPLDCVGGWKLYNTTLFTPAIYTQSINKLAQRNSPERMDDPDPLQIERSEFYKELHTTPSAAPAIGLGPRSVAELQAIERQLIDRNLAAGHRVAFLVLTDAGDAGITGSGQGPAAVGKVTIPEGYEIRALRKWTLPTPSSEVSAGSVNLFGIGGGPAGRGARGGRAGGAAAPAAGAGAGGAGRGAGRAGGVAGLLGLSPAPVPAAAVIPRQGATYTLFEVLRPMGR